jgi:hypothetical protein
MALSLKQRQAQLARAKKPSGHGTRVLAVIRKLQEGETNPKIIAQKLDCGLACVNRWLRELQTWGLADICGSTPPTWSDGTIRHNGGQKQYLWKLTIKDIK